MRTPGTHPEEKGERGLKYPSQWSMEDRVSLKGFHMGLSCIYPRIGYSEGSTESVTCVLLLWNTAFRY